MLFPTAKSLWISNMNSMNKNSHSILEQLPIEQRSHLWCGQMSVVLTHFFAVWLLSYLLRWAKISTNIHVVTIIVCQLKPYFVYGFKSLAKSTKAYCEKQLLVWNLQKKQLYVLLFVNCSLHVFHVSKMMCIFFKELNVKYLLAYHCTEFHVYDPVYVYKPCHFCLL